MKHPGGMLCAYKEIPKAVYAQICTNGILISGNTFLLSSRLYCWSRIHTGSASYKNESDTSAWCGQISVMGRGLLQKGNACLLLSPPVGNYTQPRRTYLYLLQLLMLLCTAESVKGILLAFFTKNQYNEKAYRTMEQKGMVIVMEVRLTVKIQAGDIYDYMLYHQYTSPAGLIGSAVGALLVVAFFMNRQLIFLVAGVIILLYLPWTLFLKSRQQALTNPAFAQELEYILNDEGLSVRQGEAEETQSWENMYRAVSTGRSIIVYTSPINATIIPKRCMVDSKMDVIRVISTHMPPKKVKIRG